MDTVKRWAGSHGYDYHFVDDRLFEYVPAWFREKSASQKLPQTDLARLLVAKELLSDDYERAVWIDADVVIFDPDKFSIDLKWDFLVCMEVWIGRDRHGKTLAQKKVNNAVLVFERRNRFLDFYIFACQSIVRKLTREIRNDEVGTRFLTGLDMFVPLPMMATLAMLSPMMCQAILQGHDDILDLFAQHHPHPCYAANLCGSLVGSVTETISPLTPDTMLALVERLIETRGADVNARIVQRKPSGQTTV
jgi:hypothetical protein